MHKYINYGRIVQALEYAADHYACVHKRKKLEPQTIVNEYIIIMIN